MGNIIIANMQAHLTLDKHQFDEGMTAAEARLMRIEQRMDNLPQDLKSNVGQATGDPEQQGRQRRQQARQAEASDEISARERVNSQLIAQNAQLVTSVRAVGTEYAATMQQILATSAQAIEQVRTLATLMERTSQAQGRATGRATERAPRPQAPLEVMGPHEFIGPPEFIGPRGSLAMTPEERRQFLSARGFSRTSGGQAGPLSQEAMSFLGRGSRAPSPWWQSGKAGGGTGGGADDDYLAEEAIAAEAERKRLASMAQAAGTAAAAPSGTGGYPTGKKPAGPVVASTSTAAGLPEDLRRRLQEMAAANPSQPENQIDAVRAAIAPYGVTHQYEGIQQFIKFAEDYQKQITPEAQYAQALATEQALAREAAGKPHDPLQAAFDRNQGLRGGPGGQQPSGRAGGAPGGGGKSGTLGPYGAGSYAYERAFFTQSIPGAAAMGFTQNFSPELAQLLPALVSPVTALVAGATALGLAFHVATEQLKAYNAAQFILNEQVRARGQAGGIRPDFIQAQEGRMGALGVGRTEETQLLTQLARYTQNQAEIVQIQKEAADFARANGISMQQSLGIFIESSQGNSGGFQQFIPGVRAGDTFDYARGEAARLYGGAADRFMETSQGRQSARDARMEDLGIHLGEQLEPAMEALAETAELLLPPLAEITGWFGKLASTLLGTVGAFGDIVEGFFKLGGVDFANVKRGLDLVGGNVEAGANLFPNLAPTQFQRATQLYRNADGTYGAANARGGLNGEVDYSSPFAVEQALKNLALSNPELGSRSMTSVVTPEQELRRRVQAYSPEGNIQQAYEYAVSAGAFAESGKFIGGTAGGVAGSAGGVTTGGGTGTGGLDTGELANNASAHISAMQQVDQEMSLSLSAMKGVQDVFSELSTFRVDFSQLKPNLDNLYDGITFLQQFWIDAAKSKETGITDRVYQQTQTWLEMVSAMVSLMTNASSMFADMTVNAAMMPTDDEMESLVNKSAKLFEMGDAIAKAVMKEGAAKGMEDLGDVKAWADRTQNVMQAISMAADAMVKVRNIRVPDAADIGRLGAGIRSIQTEIMTIAKDAVAANQAGGGIDISTAQTWVDKVSPLFQFAGMIADVFTKMRNLRIPTDDQIGAFEKAADNMLGGLVAIAKAFTGQREGGEPSPMDMYHETSGPSVDPFLAQAAETMGNAEKIMGFASTAASTFENMRRLRIPSDDSMDDLVGGAFDFLGKLTAAIPKGEDQQPVDLQLEAVYAAQGQAILGMAGAAVSVFQGMRRLRIPDQGAIDDMSQRSVKLVGSVASYVPKTAEGYTVDLSDQATYSEQGSKILGMVNTAVNLYQDMHRLRMPSPGMLDEVAKRAVDTVNSVASYLPADGDALHEAGLAAEDANKLVTLASNTASLLKSLRRFRGPAVEDVKEFMGGLSMVTEMLIGVGGKARNDMMLAQMEAWGAAVGPAVQIALDTATLLQELRRVRQPSVDAVASFVGTTELIADMMLGIAQGTPDNMLMIAEDWAKAVGPLMQIASTSAQLIKGLQEYEQPTKQVVDNFVATTQYISDAFIDSARSRSEDMAEHAGYIAEQQEAMFQNMNSAASVFSQLSTLGNTPKQMITGFFKSMDEAVDLYNSLVDSWDHDMSFANIRVAEDVEAQMGALAQTADFFHKLDDLKPDYSSSIRGFFNHLKVAMNEMATAMPQFAQQMNPETDKIAKFMKNQGDALNAALAPILNVEQAAFVYPEDIDRSMENVKRLMARFSELGNDPALQGDNLANIKLFSSQMGEIFGNLSTVVEGANLMGAPGEDGQGITFASTMETFFNVDVVNYGILWHNVMMGMAEDSEMMAGRTITALGNTPMSGAGSGKSLVASGGNNYTNCIIVNGSVVAEGEDISTLVKKMSQYDTVRQGGVPVGMER